MRREKESTVYVFLVFLKKVLLYAAMREKNLVAIDRRVLLRLLCVCVCVFRLRVQRLS